MGRLKLIKSLKGDKKVLSCEAGEETDERLLSRVKKSEQAIVKYCLEAKCKETELMGGGLRMPGGVPDWRRFDGEFGRRRQGHLLKSFDKRKR